ncbi:MAG: hypothetical protein FWH19_05260 [Treponema sp.]|nr:hypothetical protein [Treponema sp.]
MNTTYCLKADELNPDFIQTLKNTYRQKEIIILSKEDFDELEKIRHNAAFTTKLETRIKSLDEGKGIVKTMAELEAIANG